MLQFTTDDFSYQPEHKTFIEESGMLGLHPREWNSLHRIPDETEILLTNPKTKTTSVFHYESSDMSPENEVGGWVYKNKENIRLIITNG